MGISSWAPCIPCTSWPEAKINWGIGAGCCDPNKGFDEGSAVAEGGWEFIAPLIILGDESVILLDWVLRGVAA